MRKQGFTLIELLVVVIIISTLTVIMLPQYRRAMDRSKAAEAMQVLPALFEARERWVLSNFCHWDHGGLRGDNAGDACAVFKVIKLDIQIPGTITDNTSSNNNNIDNIKIQTDNFDYYLVVPGVGLNQPCVTAKPRFGANRGLTSATIYYRGDKFSCTDGDSTQSPCDLLNVTPDGNRYRTGCI